MTRHSVALLAVALAGCITAPTGGQDPSDSEPGVRELAGDSDGTKAPEGTTCEGGQGRVIGRINDKYLELGGCTGILGKPLTDEKKTPDGVGRFSVFEQGSIYWTPTIGAHEVHGRIRDGWKAVNWEVGPLGYPVSDEYGVDEGRRSNFEGGTITWVKATNEDVIRYNDTRGEATYYNFNSGGACGWPTPPDKLIAAINDEQYSKANCGRCAAVTGPKGTVVVRIVDKCPGCGWGDLDLSAQAFDRIASRSAGRVGIGWHFVACR